MKLVLAAVGSATVAVLSQSSDVAAIFGGVSWSTIIAPFTCCCMHTNSVVASIVVVP